MRLAVSTPAVQRVLALTGVDRLLDIYPSVTAALSDPQKKQVHEDGTIRENADTDGGAA